MTLQDVADASGLSTSFLSDVERGQVDISVARFSRLALAFDARPSDLLADTEAHTTPRRSLPGSGVLIDRGPGVTFRLLPNQEYGVQSFHVSFEPGAGFTDETAHLGADIIWVYEGELTLVFAGEPYRVPSGSCISFASTTPHAYRNDGDVRCETFGVSTSPAW